METPKGVENGDVKGVADARKRRDDLTNYISMWRHQKGVGTGVQMPKANHLKRLEIRQRKYLYIDM